MSMFQVHPQYYRHFLYSAIVEASARDEPSLRDLPAELITRILAMAALSCRTTGLALALTSPWTAHATLPARVAHVSLRTHRHFLSFHSLVCSSTRAAAAVRTLWIGDSIGWEGDLAISAILAACSHIQALTCNLAPLEILCRSEERFPPWLLSAQITLTEFMGMPWQSPVTKWTRLARSAHGTTFLHNLTHLRLTCHHYLFDESFPMQHLPHLTHLAISSERTWSRNPTEYATYLSAFTHYLQRLWTSTSLQLAVLVFRAPSRSIYHQKISVWDPCELGRAVKECGSNILTYCPPQYHFRESKFWAECVVNGEDIWSLALKQKSLFSNVNDS
ncbi:hypothetical protein FB451DRAFT_82776 [Mycena latifolia]|nr:hypothetical protein FB451DRAFT_82776 [Mycena latifolia]